MEDKPETYPGPGEWPPDLMVEAPTEEPIAPPEPPEAVVVAPDEHVGFYQPNATIVEGQWGGLPNFQCSACAYDSLERDKTQIHLSIHGQTFTE